MTEPSTTRDAYGEILSRLTELQASSDRVKAPVIPLIDPTANVLALVAAETKRQDDLRAASERRSDDLRNQETHYEQKLREAESKRIDALNLAESRRIDSNFAAQLNATALANARAELTATALAERVDTAAKTLATSAGRSGGSAAIWAAVATMAFLVIAVLGLVLALSR